MRKKVLILFLSFILLISFAALLVASEVKLPKPPAQTESRDYRKITQEELLKDRDAIVKWTQLPDLNPTGMDVSDFNNPPYGPYLLADDFLCTTTGPITDIAIWGSWWQDYLPGGNQGNVTFTLSIHADIPANENPYGPYSMPGEVLWLGTPMFESYLFEGGLQEGWFEPPSDYEPIGDTQCWTYVFHLIDPFIQQGTPENPIIYWLDVQATPMDPMAYFGWKTSIYHWNDDAAWTMGVDPVPAGQQWNELRYPPGHVWMGQSIDLAFEIMGEETPQTGACCYPDGSCADLNENDCLQSGGIWGGVGTLCQGDNDNNLIDDACEGLYPMGACCFADQTCIVTYQIPCEATAGTQYMGDGTDCTDGDGNLIADICEVQPQVGACCFPDGSCMVLTQVDCQNASGTYKGDGTVCFGDYNSNGIDDACETWIPGDPYKMHYPQLPDEAGWDVNATQPLILADDFMCSETGWIKDIHFWGSWMHGVEGEILYFVLSLHADIPADPPQVPYSRPGPTLWESIVTRFVATPIDPPTVEGWYDPSQALVLPGDHMAYFQYDVILDSLEWFHQTAGTVYWLNISAVVADPSVTQWGWKSSIEHWNDDAVWGLWNELNWIDLWEPPFFEQSLDLAFVITGEGHEVPQDTCTYYKSRYPDYAPNGMPDFDQKQDNWTGATGAWSYCGPVALANCFWWFDSKFEPYPADPRPFYPDPLSPGWNDGYPLVQTYDPTGGWDDHDINNVMPFVDSLALYSNCNVATTGTYIHDLVNGAITWLNSRGLGESYTVTAVQIPPFELIRDQVLISQDVILLLGFYEVVPTGECNRLGGHYVTVAGVCEDQWQLCISDPWYDKNEGEPPAGSAHGSGVHNDAFNVSGPHGTIHHDAYDVFLNIPPVCTHPAGLPPVIGLSDYPDNYPDISNFDFQNQSDPPIDPMQYTGGEIVTLVDFAIIICPVEHEPDIDVVPDTVGYQRCIETDTTYTGQFQVCNTGTAMLTVSGITCDLGFVNVATPMPLLVPAGTCAYIDIRINTTGIPSGAYAGDFHVSSDDPGEPVVNKPHIKVAVVAQDIAVSPDSIYHQQLINTIVTYPSDFTVYNNGPCPLSYNTTYVPPWATLLGATGYIPPLSNDPVDVRINTNTLVAGTYIDSVTILSDDPDTPTLYKPKIVLVVTEGPSNFNYLPGDVNMAGGTWPPAATGPDVTYLVNYFRSYPTSVPCLMHNPGAVVAPPYFWASADANGDCNLIGSDVTKLVNFFRGLTTLSTCIDYPPNYPPIPGAPPTGWPNCATLPLIQKTVIPTESGK